MLAILLLCESYHHAKRRQAANQITISSAIISTYQRSNDYQSHSDMQNRIQSQTFAVIISCLYIYIFFLSSIFFLLNLKTFRSITAGIHGITGVRITGISRGWLRVSQKRAAEKGGFPKPHLGHK